MPDRKTKTEFTARNPDFAEAVADAFKGQPFLAHIGAILERVTPGFCQIALPKNGSLVQNMGFFHGGAIASLVDVCGGFAGWSLLPADKAMLTVEYKTNILAPGQGERLVGRGRVIRAGRTLTTTEVEILVCNGDRMSLCATGLQTLMAVDRPAALESV